MAIPGLIAKQLGRPSGWFGRYVMGRFLNRKTAAHNEMVRQELAPAPGDRVLEVGFGGAALLERLSAEASNGSVAGVEISDEMLALARKRLRGPIAAGRVVLTRGSVEALPFGDEEFDKACTVNTTYFWSDLGAGLFGSTPRPSPWRSFGGWFRVTGRHCAGRTAPPWVCTSLGGGARGGIAGGFVHRRATAFWVGFARNVLRSGRRARGLTSGCRHSRNGVA